MKFLAITLGLALITIFACSQTKKKSGPHAAGSSTTTQQNAQITPPASGIFSDTLRTMVDTVKVKYYFDQAGDDGAEFVAVKKGYVIRTSQVSDKVKELNNTQGVLYDSKFAKVDPLTIMNVREFRW